MSSDPVVDSSALVAPTRPAPTTRWHHGVELLSSMRFAIALLTLICITSVIGTVVQQNQPAINYVNEFGPFWASVFERLGLFSVYSSSWFLLILAFLVTSTSLCLWRNVPKIVADLKNYKEHLREGSLKAFHHKAEGEWALGKDAALDRLAAVLGARGWKARVQEREHGVMVAAKQGVANRLGYIAAHSAIVLVCMGGLLDGDLIVHLQMLVQGKSAYVGDGQVHDVPVKHRLSDTNPTFRGNLFVPEGGTENIALITLSEGVVLQPLPFQIELKKFIVDYYETGMPKLFASDVVIHDADGKTTAARIKVNEPLEHDGVTIFQSGFEDGGSHMRLRAHPMGPSGGASFEVKGDIGTSLTLSPAQMGSDESMQLEFTGFRAINVENMAPNQGASTDVRKVDLGESVSQHLGSGARNTGLKSMQNIGPSISYKLRDKAGQAREFNNFMQPSVVDGQRVFLLGVRESPDQPFRYLRPPADAKDSLGDWLRLKVGLSDRAQREKAAQRYAQRITPKDRSEMIEPLRQSALRALSLFAGAELPTPGASPTAGMLALQTFIEARVQPAEREAAAQMMVRILDGALLDLLNQAREKDGEPPLVMTQKIQEEFLVPAAMTLSDSFAYPAPLLFTLEGFDQVQASVFQVTRTPGKKLVYLGAVLLALGVLAMLYIRERRLWVWIEPREGGSYLHLAYSVNRASLDTDRDFETLKQVLLNPTPQD
ncbi:MAG: cytochrome c biogenesis protein ResB [Leptothrix ochracea]|uniref:cytochrome c biogenesis protein ResB n=2 Tax=Leptothrix ochracea TaxID=735331 RepID=UPI0034E2D63F